MNNFINKIIFSFYLYLNEKIVTYLTRKFRELMRRSGYLFKQNSGGIFNPGMTQVEGDPPYKSTSTN